MARRLTLTLAALALAACSTPPSPTPTPPPDPVVATSPYLEAIVAAWIAEYSAAQDQTPFKLDVLPTTEALDRIEDGELELAIIASIPYPDWFATPLAREGIAIIVHPSNPLRDLSLDDIHAIFSGRIDSWDSMGGSSQPVKLILPLQSEEIRTQFEASLSFISRPTLGAQLAPSPAAMITLVGENPGAIGYIPLSQVTSRVRTVRVNAVLPSTQSVQEGRYPLCLEILATAPSEPVGLLRDWLAWLQGTAAE